MFSCISFVEKFSPELKIYKRRNICRCELILKFFEENYISNKFLYIIFLFLFYYLIDTKG